MVNFFVSEIKITLDRLGLVSVGFAFAFKVFSKLKKEKKLLS